MSAHERASLGNHYRGSRREEIAPEDDSLMSHSTGEFLNFDPDNPLNNIHPSELRDDTLARDLHDGMRTYLEDIKPYHLLTAEQERALAYQIEATEDPEQKVALRNQMIMHNQPLVIAIAKRYSVPSGMERLDLILEGNLGLLRAIEKFDVSKGYKLSSFAIWWIRQAMGRAIQDQSRTVRLSPDRFGQIREVSQAEKRLEDIFERNPTANETARLLGVAPERVVFLKKIAQEEWYLSRPIDGEQEHELGDILPSPEKPVEEYSEQAALQEDVGHLLDQMDERSRGIIRKRRGLEDDTEHTLREVGDIFGLSGERIRQIEDQHFKQWQKDVPHLREYLE